MFAHFAASDFKSEKSGSLRSLGSSIRRAASRSISMSRKHRAASPAPAPDNIKPPTNLAAADSPEDEEEKDEEDEAMDVDAPPSPAIGVVKRHRSMALHHRPSTIRLVSPGPAEFAELARSFSPEPVVANVNTESDDELPLTGLNSVDAIKKRRSIQFLSESTTANQGLNRRSMPVLTNNRTITMSPRKTSAPTSTPKLYPDLSAIGGSPQMVITEQGARSPSPEIPGSFPSPSAVDKPSAPPSPSFVFGAGAGTSSATFSDAGMKLLQEMQAKMGGAAFNPELLKGKNAELSKLVSTNTTLGSSTTGGWGLSSTSSTDRFSKVHQREFSKMPSISSISTMKTASNSSIRAPGTPAGTKRKLERDPSSGSLPHLVNGLPAPPTAEAAPKEDKEEGRSSKRAKTSTAPRYLPSMSSIRGASRAVVSKLSDSVGPSTARPRIAGNSTIEKRASRFFLGHRKTASDAKSDKSDGKSDSKSIGESVTSEDYVLLGSAKKSKAKETKEFELRRTPTISKRISSLTSASTSNLLEKAVKQRPQRPVTVMASTATLVSTATTTQTARVTTTKSRSTSASAEIAMSSAPPVAAMVALKGSPEPEVHETRAAQPRPMSSADSLASSRASRKRSAETLPPSSFRSSLLAPTASSLARMQATVRPPAEHGTPGRVTRPLPRPPAGTAPGVSAGVSIAGIAPQIPTMSPFGAAASRTNYLFESNFHFPSPATPGNDTKADVMDKPAKADKADPKASLRKSPSANALRPVPIPIPTTPSGIPLRKVESTAPRTPKTPRTPRPAFGKSPARPTVASAQRARERASGVAGIKARGHDEGATQRRAEIKARQERIRQERELRAMLR
jgi:hypothetical protein